MGRIFVAIAAIALALFFRNEAVDYRLAASRLPDLIGGVLILLSVLMIAQVIWSWRKASVAGNLSILPNIEPRSIMLGVAFVLLIFSYAWAIKSIGYLIVTPIFLLIVFAVFRPVNWLWIAAITVIVTASIWAIFIFFLNMPILLYPGS